MLKFVYSFFLGLLLLAFVGMGVATFYPSPEAPEYPGQSTPLNEKEPSQEAQVAYQKDYETYNKQSESYNRNVAVVVLVAAVVLSVLGLVLESRVGILADGLLLGGVFTLIYSIGRSFAGADPKYSFVVVTAGLVVTSVVGYLKFIKLQPATAKKKR